MGKEKRKFKFIDGPATKELAKYIPLENIRFYYFLYRAIKTCNTQALNDYNFRKKREDMTKVLFNSIEGKTTWKYAERRLSEIFMDGIIDGLTKKILKTNHRPNNNALYILLYALRFDLIHYTGRPKYKLISDFLVEQGINEYATYDDIKRKFREVLKKPICHILMAYQDSFNVIIEAFEIGSLQGIYNGGFYSHFNEYDKLHKTSFVASLRG